MDGVMDPPRVMFGKWKGECAGCVLKNDLQYAEWAVSQEWLASAYPELDSFWRTAGVRPMRTCIRTTGDGNPCSYRARYGPLCGTHYRAAEKSMVTIVNEMAAEWGMVSWEGR